MAKEAFAWRRWSPEVFEESKTTGKPIFLLITVSWSEAASVAPAAISADTVSGPLLRDSFVPVLADATRLPEVPRQYGISTFPSGVLLRNDGAVLARLASVEPDALRDLLQNVARTPVPLMSGSGPGLGELRVPYIPLVRSDLERGLEMVEAIREKVEALTDSGLDPMKALSADDCIEPLRFLLHYGSYTGDRRVVQRAVSTVHTLSHSNLYDPVEGGFFAGRDASGLQTHKLLRDNAGWLILALRVSREPGGEFSLPLARGILHYLQSRLGTASGAFCESQREDPAYYALTSDERRRVNHPPTDASVYISSNALAVRALCKGWRLLGERAYLDAALKTFRFRETYLLAADGTPAHCYDGEPSGMGYLGDLLELGQAYLALYHSTLEPAYLDGTNRVAEQLVAGHTNPGGAGFLDMRVGPGKPTVPIQPVVDYRLNARAAGFLVVASAQLQREALAVPAKAALGALMESGVQDLVSLSHLGNALLAALYPMAVFEAVSDGSMDQRIQILEKIREQATTFSVVLHRAPTRREGMQALPRLISHCGIQCREVPVTSRLGAPSPKGTRGRKPAGTP
jgi:uncharacterized protein YyaL (SSP411 family)